jgi:Zn-dependent protease with chaperone function
LPQSVWQAVFAHELGHLKCDHGIWLTFANLLALSAIQLPGVGALLANSIESVRPRNEIIKK